MILVVIQMMHHTFGYSTTAKVAREQAPPRATET